MNLSHNSLKPQWPVAKPQLPDILTVQGGILDYVVGLTKKVDENLFGISQPNTDIQVDGTGTERGFLGERCLTAAVVPCPAEE